MAKEAKYHYSHLHVVPGRYVRNEMGLLSTGTGCGLHQLGLIPRRTRFFFQIGATDIFQLLSPHSPLLSMQLTIHFYLVQSFRMYLLSITP